MLDIANQESVHELVDVNFDDISQNEVFQHKTGEFFIFRPQRFQFLVEPPQPDGVKVFSPIETARSVFGYRYVMLPIPDNFWKPAV